MLVCCLVSCGKKKADDPMGDNGHTKRTENLLSNLSDISAKGYLFGHQDATLYGEGWADDSAHSDVEVATGDMPGQHIHQGADFLLAGLAGDDVEQGPVGNAKIRQRALT